MNDYDEDKRKQLLAEILQLTIQIKSDIENKALSEVGISDKIK